MKLLWKLARGGGVIILVVLGLVAWYYWFSLPAGRIAFHSDRNGNFDIYVMETRGRRPQRLTYSPTRDSHPSWSPDGEWLAFQSERAGNAEIYIVSADGRVVRRLTDNAFEDLHPSWSPDGRWIAFTSTRAGNADIYLVSPDGKREVRLTTHAAVDQRPGWSADSQRVLFFSNRGMVTAFGRGQLYAADLNGHVVAQLSRVSTLYNSPAASPDGRWVAFDTLMRGSKIYLLDVRNGRTHALVDGKPSPLVRALWRHEVSRKLLVAAGYRPYGLGIEEYDPAWTAEGTHLLFSRWNGNNMDIYIADTAGSHLRRLTFSPAYDAAPAWWSP